MVLNVLGSDNILSMIKEVKDQQILSIAELIEIKEGTNLEIMLEMASP